MGSFDHQMRPVSAAEQWRNRQAMNLAGLANSRAPVTQCLMNAYRPAPLIVARHLAEGAGVHLGHLLWAAPSITQREGIVLSIRYNARTREIHSVTVEVRTRIPRVRRLEKTPPEGHNPPDIAGEADGGESTETTSAGRD